MQNHRRTFGELRTSNEREELALLRMVLDSVTDEVWFCDTDARFVFVNAAGARNLDLELAEGEYLTLNELLERVEVLGLDFRPRKNGDLPVQRSLRGETIIAEDEVVRHSAKGPTQYRQVSSAPLRDQQGEIIGAVAVVRDVTERRLAEGQAQTSLRLLEQTFAALSDAVFVVEPRSRLITACNQAVEQVFGYQVDEVIGRTTEFLHVDHSMYRRFGQELYPALDANGFFQTRFRMRRKDSTEFMTENTVTGYRDDTGARIGVVSVVRDITEQVETEAKLKRQLQALAHVERVARMGELAASLAHELNQPLMGILANAQAARRFLDADQPDLGEVRRTLDDIIEDDQRAARFIASIRSLLKKEDPGRAPFDINEAIRQVLTINRSEAVTRNIPVRARLGRSIPPVRGDSVQIQQVVLNLLLNAEQAISATGVREAGITISTRRGDHGDVIVSVTDSGPGIPPEDLERIFEAFNTTRPDGFGMGLSISRSLIESHGGCIWAENRRSRGARVSFSLPTAAEGNA